jgi:CubicO group peptidase (beta-lactamase class C family)
LWKLTRARPVITITTGVVATLITGLYPPPGDSMWWLLSDVVLYGTFTALGMHFLIAGVPRFKPAVVMIAATSLALGICSAVLSPPLDGVVNNSHMLHLFLGIFWTLTLFLSGATVSQFSRTRFAQEINRRSLTVYLWHSPVAWALWQILPDELTGVWRAIMVTLLTFLIVPLLTRGVGVLEDVGQRRLRLRNIFLSIPATFALLAPFLISYTEGRLDFRSAPAGAPLPPSQAPVIEKVRIDSDVIAFAKSPPSGGLASLTRQKKLDELLKRAKRNLGVRSLRAMITTRDGETWFRSVGVSRPLESPSFIGSITKTFTTALVMDAVQRGEVDLDAPIGDLGIKFRYTSITLRQLLRHRAGVPRTSVASGIIYDGVTPEDVARWVSENPLDYQPGTSYKYSTTGFVLIGLVLEKATGMPFETLLQNRIAEKFDLELDLFTGRYRSVGYSTGGVAMRVDELARWARIYVDDRGATTMPWPWAIRQTTGLGIHGYCPCDDGNFMALGHMGGRTFMSVDGDGVVVILDTDGVLVGDNLSKTVATAHELRLIAGGGRTYAWTAE